MAKCARCFKYKPAKGKELCTTCIVHDEKASGSVYPEALTRAEVINTAEKLWEEFTENHQQVFADDAEKTIEELQGELMDGFTEEEKPLLITKRNAGDKSLKNQALFARRDIAVERLFMYLSHRSPQTKRHAYYRCKAIDLCGKDPSSADPYFSNKIGETIGAGTWAGRIPWNRVLDNRIFHSVMSDTSVQDSLTTAVDLFTMDFAQGQSTRMIAVTEKDAVIESISNVCRKRFVPRMSFHGQASDGAVHKLAQQIADWREEGCRSVVVVYAGDYDRGGLIIDDSANGRLQKMLRDHFPQTDVQVEIKRIAITREDLDDPQYDQYTTPLSLRTEEGKLSKKKFSTYREYLNLLNPWFAELDVKRATTMELEEYEPRLDLRTLGIDILSAEEIEERFDTAFQEVYSRQTAADKQRWEENEEKYVDQKRELEALINLYTSVTQGLSDAEAFQQFYDTLRDKGTNNVVAWTKAVRVFEKRGDLITSIRTTGEDERESWKDRALSVHAEDVEEGTTEEEVKETHCTFCDQLIEQRDDVKPYGWVHVPGENAQCENWPTHALPEQT